MKGSDYLGDQDAIEIMCSEAGREVIAMEHMGVIFSRDEEGRLGTRAFGGQRQARTFFVADFTGQALLHVLYEQVMQANVRVYEEWFVLSLVVEDGECCGAVVMEMRTGDVHLVRAKAVIIAAGGLGRVFEPSTNALICTGDGMSLAYRAGAPLMDMEMVQYHPTTLKSNGALMSEGARGEGAYLINADGERFMERYAPNMMELASRDVVSRSEQTEIDEGRGNNGCVFLDCRHLGEKLIDEKLSQIPRPRPRLRQCRHGDGARAHQARHALPDGRRQDRRGRHDQCAGTICRRRGRLRQRPRRKQAWGELPAGHPRVRAQVRRARRRGLQVDAATSPSTSRPPRLRRLGCRPCLTGMEGGESFGKIRFDMGVTMNDRLAVFRDRDGIREAMATLAELKDRFSRVVVMDKGKTFNTNLIFTLELGFMLDCAETIALGALEREESRGAHFRTDMQTRDDENWLRHILLSQGQEGPAVEYLPVVITQWQPQARTY